MERSLIRIQGDASGWACTNCGWTLPVPTLLGGDEAMAAYDRLAAAKFRDHKCEDHTAFLPPKEPVKKEADTGFAERARMLIKRGYKPKVAVEAHARRDGDLNMAATAPSWKKSVPMPRISCGRSARASSENPRRH